jgi:hypothetical protein
MHLLPFSCKRFNNGQKYSYTEETHAARLGLAVNNRFFDIRTLPTCMWGGSERNTKVMHSIAGEDGREDKLR